MLSMRRIEFTIRSICVGVGLLFAQIHPAVAADLKVVGDGVAQALTPTPGDAPRGRALVANRQQGMCLLCHDAPIKEERFQGNLGPSLAGVGARLSAAQLRMRIVDQKLINPDSIMPAYHRAEKLQRVGAAWRDHTIFTAQQVEDVVAYLVSLK